MVGEVNSVGKCLDILSVPSRQAATKSGAQSMSTFVQAPPYVPKHKIRVVTAASLFDGHDADELEPELNNGTHGGDLGTSVLPRITCSHLIGTSPVEHAEFHPDM